MSGEHTWADRGKNEKRCTGCFTIAARRWWPGPEAGTGERSGGDTAAEPALEAAGYDVQYFAPDGTWLAGAPPCTGAPPRPRQTGRRGLFWVYLQLNDRQAGELAAVVREECLMGWQVHATPPFVSVRLTAASMTSAQDTARTLVTAAFRRAGLAEPQLPEAIAIPAPAAAPPARPPTALQLCLQTG